MRHSMNDESKSLRKSSFSRFRVESFRLSAADSIVDEHGINKVHPEEAIDDSEFISHAADTLTEGWRIYSFLTVMTVRLIRLLGLSWFAWVMFFRLMCFATLLLPAFLKLVYRYFTSCDIYRDFYGAERRQSMDIYVKNRTDSGKKPVIVFISGGAWIIGYKAWGALMGFCYSAAGYVFVTPDYRNFPQQNVNGMISDVDLAMDWCLLNIDRYGGDSDNIVLSGQSAGAHLGAMVLLNAIARKANLSRVALESDREIMWTLDHIKGFIAISGPFNLVSLVPHLNERGLNTALLHMLFMNQEDVYSPSQFAHRIREEGLPVECDIPVILLHGTADVTVPHSQSEEFFQALKLLLPFSKNLQLELMEGLTHTDPIIELPMKGIDPLFQKCLNALACIFPDHILAQEKVQLTNSPMLPLFLIDIARWCNPF